MTLRDKTAIAGRPRRFEPADELRRLFDAALVVMERNGYTDAAVADILAEADLSTRSFYRHFESKDQLLCALYRREAERAAERLTARVSAAATPLAALGSWIDEIMSLGFHRRKAARVAVLGSPGAMRAEGYADPPTPRSSSPSRGPLPGSIRCAMRLPRAMRCSVRSSPSAAALSAPPPTNPHIARSAMNVPMAAPGRSDHREVAVVVQDPPRPVRSL